MTRIADQPPARQAQTDGSSTASPGRRISRAFRHGWVGPPRPGVGNGILLFASLVLAVGGFLRRGEMDPAQGAVFAGFALVFLADFVGVARRAVVVALRVIGTAIAGVATVLVVSATA